MAALPPDRLCQACGQPIDDGDRHCRHCGHHRQRRVVAWYHRPGWILVLAFTVLGPFALPLVYRSPAMDRRAKWLLTLVILAVTAVAAYGCWKASLLLIDECRRITDELSGAGTF